MDGDCSRPAASPLPWHADRQAVRFVLVLAAYFLVQLLLRVSLSDSLDLDEAEQAYESQRLRMGYGTQPPLYNWLQWLLFSVFGLNLFALSLLKNLLLFATYCNMFLLARPLVGTACAAAVSASLLLLPQIGWESQRDLTHSVLLTTIACASLGAYLGLLRRPSALRYAVFGLLIGLGLQTKYNFALFSAGLAAASLMVPQHRAIVWNRNILVAAAVAVLCFLPHGLWVLGNLQTAAGGTLAKLNADSNGSYFANLASGLGSLLVAALGFITPLWLVYAIICRRFLKDAAPARDNPHARFFLCLYAAFFGAILLMLLSGEVTKVKDRWMQPLLFSAPLAFFLLFPALARPVVLRRILQTAAVAAGCILLALPLRVYLGPSAGKYVRAHYPFPALAAELARRHPDIDTVVSNYQVLAGNLHFHQPRLETLLLEELQVQPLPLQGNVLVVSPVTGGESGLPAFQALYPQARLLGQERITLPFRYGGTGSVSYEVSRLVVPPPSPL